VHLARSGFGAFGPTTGSRAMCHAYVENPLVRRGRPACWRLTPGCRRGTRGGESQPGCCDFMLTVALQQHCRQQRPVEPGNGPDRDTRNGDENPSFGCGKVVWFMVKPASCESTRVQVLSMAPCAEMTGIAGSEVYRASHPLSMISHALHQTSLSSTPPVGTS